MTATGQGKWNILAEELRQNPEHKRTIEDVGPNVASRLRNLGLSVESTLSKRRAETGQSYDRYNLTVWWPQPTSEVTKLAHEITSYEIVAATARNNYNSLTEQLKALEIQYTQDRARIQRSIRLYLKERKNALAHIERAHHRLTIYSDNIQKDPS